MRGFKGSIALLLIILARGEHASPFLTGLISLAVALVVPLYTTAFSSYQLALVPDALQARVTAAMRVLSSIGWPLGVALSGIFIQRFGAVPTMVVVSILNVGIAVATMSRSIRDVPAP